MKLFLIITICIGIVSAAKLPSNNYLPPPSGAIGSGGHSGFLQGPSRPTGQYLPPTSFGSTNVLGHGVSSGSGGYTGASYGGHGGHGGSYTSTGHGGSYTGTGYGGSQTGYGGSYGGSGQYQSHGQQIPILKYENVNNGDGSYHFEYATGNGITQNEQGYLNNPGSDYAEQVVQGSYSYTGDDGRVYTVHYKADANGFQATGDHLPTPPPIPEAIQKSLIYNAQHAQSSTGGGYDHSSAYSGGGGGGGSRPQSQYLPPSRPSYSSSSGYHY